MNFKPILSGSLLLVFICTDQPAEAQTETDQLAEPLIESVAENLGEDFDYSEFTERLNYYRKNPVDLNKTSTEQLKELLFLSPVQIAALIRYRDHNGPFLDLAELQVIEGFDQELIKGMLPFVTVNSQVLTGTSINKLIKRGSNDVIFRYGQLIEKQQGFLPPDSSGRSRYLGTPQKFLLRYRYTYGQHISASVNMEKDAGEAFFAGKQSSGFDFYSGNIFIRDWGKVKKLALGDYSLSFGQGLTLWSGLSFGKGAAISAVPKQDIGLRPYSSTNESLFLRGLAATIALRGVALTPFASYHKLDAILTEPENGASAQQITSLVQSGLHRTSTELKNEHSVTQLLYGINAQYDLKHFAIGSVIYQTRYDHSFEPGDQLYNKYEFSGKKLSNAGVYYHYNWHNLYIFGEAAHSLTSGYAYVNGVIASLSPRVSLVLLHRNYQRAYQSLYNQAIAESGIAVNENGFYSGLMISPAPELELSAYADFFHFPWLKFRADSPSGGYELFSQLTYSPNKLLKASLRYRYKLKEENDDIENTINFLEAVEKQNYRAEISFRINDALKLRNRVEMVRYKKEDHPREAGYLAYQDLIFDLPGSKFSGNMRFAIFDIPSFDSAIYAYENDILYSYSVPGFQNKGLRFYINSRVTLKRGADIWLKYAVTSYNNLNQVGSGLDMINGKRKSDIKVQLRLQF